MTNEEIKAQETEGSPEAGTEQKEAAPRRSFIKTMVAGAVAAGALGAVPLVAKAQEAKVEALAASAPSRRLRLSFNGRRPPQLEDIYRALEQAAGYTACTRCGLLGYEIYMGCQDFVTPADAPVIITGEQFGG